MIFHYQNYDINEELNNSHSHVHQIHLILFHHIHNIKYVVKHKHLQIIYRVDKMRVVEEIVVQEAQIFVRMPVKHFMLQNFLEK